MKCNYCELLSLVARAANCPVSDSAAALKKILLLLAEKLELDSAQLSLPGDGGGFFHRVISSADAELFRPCSEAPELETEVLGGRLPLEREGLFCLPLLDDRRVLGVLSLSFSSPASLSDRLASILQAVGDQVAPLLRSFLLFGEEAQLFAPGELRALSGENDRKYQKVSLLYRISLAMHGTPRLDDLIHLLLSALTVSGGGGFERAILFTVNERSGTLQGMLGVARQTASMVFPPVEGVPSWESPVVTDEVRRAQREAPLCRQVLKLRLALDDDENPLVRAVRREQTVLVDDPAPLTEELILDRYACAPLLGRNGTLGVLVVDNPDSGEEIAPGKLRFLQLFANLAGGAMESAMLLHRLENAHQDLSETQERMIQGEKMAVLGEMAASVAHELKNPLVSIGGFSRRLSRICPPGSTEGEYSSIVAREVSRMEEMLSNILAFSKNQRLCYAGCHIPAIVDDVLGLEEEDLRQASVVLERQAAEGIPVIDGDEQKLRQVLLNLVANARQAMEGGGTLAVRIGHSSLRGDPAVEVEVQDTGGGIPVEVMRNIFNPFFSTKDRGTGLGLSISHRIVELHQGEIEVANGEKGAVFTLRLPVRASGASFR